MLCGVTATLGSNPSATATAARPHWGRAVLLCRRGVRGLLVTPLVGRAALCARGRRPARSALFVAPLVFRAPEAPAAVCAGGRRPAREARRPHCVRRRASKPAHALRSLRRPPHQWGWVADVCLCVVSKPGQASRLEARSILSFACNSLMPAVCGSVKSPEFQRLNFKA